MPSPFTEKPTDNLPEPMSADQRFNFLDLSLPSLRNVLQTSFDTFTASQLHERYRQLFGKLEEMGFDESLRTAIPNPAYHLAAQEIGQAFIASCAQMGICIGSIFPGSFTESRESDRGDEHTRSFRLPIYHSGQIIAHFCIVFPHLHGAFGFTRPPTLTLEAAPSIGNQRTDVDAAVRELRESERADELLAMAGLG